MGDPTMARLMPQSWYQPDPYKNRNQTTERKQTMSEDQTKIDAQLEAMLGGDLSSDGGLKLVAPVVPKLKQKLKQKFKPTAEKLHPAVEEPVVAQPVPMSADPEPELATFGQMMISDAPMVAATPKLVHVSQRTLDEMEAGRKSIERF